MMEMSGFLSDLEALKNLRLVGRTWKLAIEPEIDKRSSCVFTGKRIAEYQELISSKNPKMANYSTIKNLILRLDNQHEEGLKTFVDFPQIFLDQLRSLTLDFEAYNPPTFDQILKYLERVTQNLEELHVKAHSYCPDPDTPIFHLTWDSMFQGSFSCLRRLTIPLHCVLPILTASSALAHLSLEIYDPKLPSDFWISFTAASLKHQSTLRELFVVRKKNRTLWSRETLSLVFRELTRCNFRLNKFGLGIPWTYRKNSSCFSWEVKDPKYKESRIGDLELLGFLQQQASTLTYLRLPPPGEVESASGSAKPYEFLQQTDCHFPRLTELKLDDFDARTVTKLLSSSPRIQTLNLPYTVGTLSDIPKTTVLDVTVMVSDILICTYSHPMNHSKYTHWI